MAQFRYAYNQLVYYGEDVGTSIDYAGYLSFELLPPSADPFGVMQAGGHQDFLDRYTEQAIARMRETEGRLAGARA